ncbi:hypothetical protein GCM10009527_075050 [Actinomadura nitritigenes]|uniref:Uncharacterized protein n=1 Tax=Actinomadura nitritigenes TaxID=134602 RepID=A0ABS3R4B0_9ACTN|nr:hypothetical protein [Actinomadura nitritigenes]MBO2440439.1 hypothetical protein [Actinomadura nitritigenes]
MTTDIEHRLRAAFEARTAAVPAPCEPDWDTAPAPRTRRRRVRRPRLLLPALAAAGTAVLLAAVLTARGHGGQADEPGLTIGAVTPIRPAASPTLLFRSDGESPTRVVQAATGRTLGTVEPPAGYVQDWAGLTSATDNRTLFFTVKAKGGGASSPQFVARTRVDEKGRPGKALLVARVPRSRDLPAASPAPETTQAPSAWPSVTALAPSPDATRLALALSGHGGDVLVVRDLRTGKERAWSSRSGLDAISWSEDGRQVHWSADGTAGDLAVQSREGALPAGRDVPAAGDPLGAVLLPSGDRLALRQTRQEVRLVLLPSDGGGARTLDEWKDVPAFLELPAADATGRHVFYRRGDGWARLDLQTGRRTAFSLPADSTRPGVVYTW